MWCTPWYGRVYFYKWNNNFNLIPSQMSFLNMASSCGRVVKAEDSWLSGLGFKPSLRRPFSHIYTESWAWSIYWSWYFSKNKFITYKLQQPKTFYFRYRRDANETDTAEEEEAEDEAVEEAEVAAAEVESKVASEDENYACVKAMLAGTVYRSCVPKYGIIRLNCTSPFERNVLCYCHSDGCNGSNRIGENGFGFVVALLAALIFFR